MKYTIVIFLFISIGLKADWNCKKYGHIKSQVCSVTLMACPDYIDETDSGTYIVSPSCNIKTYSCMKCGEVIKEDEEEIRILVKPKQKPQIRITELILLMFEYEKECLSDSVSIGLYPMIISDTLTNNLGGITIMSHIEYVDIYEQKEPTFSEFLRWLDKKYINQ